MELNLLGWDKDFEKEFEPFKEHFSVARVAVQYNNCYRVYCAQGERMATVSGKLMHTATQRQDYPAVGDWVIIDKTNPQEERTIIRGILDRRSKFSRKMVGKSMEEQIIAANIDTAFICMSLNQNFNLRRLERYLTMAWDSGANPVVLLTKADLCPNLEERLEEAREVAVGVAIITVSSLNGRGLTELQRWIVPGQTIAFLGSSGVGKSTIINELLGEAKQVTKEISQIGDKGKHTTTNRELIVLPHGGIVIDTPGMRELHILDVDGSVDNTFGDIEGYAAQCKFSDCTHTVEPHCGVRKALDQGMVSQERYNSFIKLKKEAQYMERKTDLRAKEEYKQFAKKMSKDINAIIKNKRKR